MARLTKRDKESVAYWNGANGRSYSDNQGNIYGEAITKLAEYEDLEEQELLLRLPCKVGDTFWIVAYRDEKIIYVKCTGYTVQVDVLNKVNHAYVWLDSIEKPSDYWKLPFEDFKNQCFTTKEEAEVALAKMKEGV